MVRTDGEYVGRIVVRRQGAGTMSGMIGLREWSRRRGGGLVPKIRAWSGETQERTLRPVAIPGRQRRAGSGGNLVVGEGRRWQEGSGEEINGKGLLRGSSDGKAVAECQQGSVGEGMWWQCSDGMAGAGVDVVTGRRGVGERMWMVGEEWQGGSGGIY